MATRHESEPRRRREPGRLARILHWPLTLVGALLLAFVWAVVVEWIWHGQGSGAHSAQVLETELGWLHRDFRYGIGLLASPFEFITGGLEWTRAHIVGPLALDGAVSPYLVTMRNVILLIGTRVALILFTVPTVFVFMGAWGLVHGLAEREIRKASGANESGPIFHFAKYLNKPLLLVPAMLYLAIPFAIHPSLVFLPFAALFALLVRLMSSRFMKHFLE